MRIVGILFIVFGLVDLIGSYTGLDVWTDWIGVNLPELLWKFSAWIEIGIGWILLQFGSGASEDPSTASN